jgi:hypothetical protein
MTTNTISYLRLFFFFHFISLANLGNFSSRFFDVNFVSYREKNQRDNYCVKEIRSRLSEDDVNSLI